MLFSSRVRDRIRFSDWFVSGYAHGFILLSVLTVSDPTYTDVYGKGMDTAAVQRFHSVLQHDGFVTVADLQGRGGEPAPPPPLLGDGLTPSLAVMLANAKL